MTRGPNVALGNHQCQNRGGCERGLIRPQQRRRRRCSRPASLAVVAMLMLCFFGRQGALAEPGSKDWIDPVFTGGGVRPPNDTTIYMSVYLDRLIDVDEVNYMFSASYYFLLSWVDTRAPGNIAEATAAVDADPSKECSRPCNRQKTWASGALCCDSLWLPTIIMRNINEMPQGRGAVSYITASPEGVVVWRMEVRADLYTTLDLVAFPFDHQSLDMVLQILGQQGDSVIRVVPSATGTKLFLAGTGDDLSRFTVEGLRIYAHDPEPWSEQFNDPKLKNLRTFSAWDDPAPVVPLPAGALLPSSVSTVRAVADRAFGSDFTVTEVVVAIIISRNSLFDSLNIILPVVVCTCISLLTFFVEPDKLDTRLQIIITLFLSLVAIQFVVESELPSSSYVLPTRQLVIVSYLVLLLVCFEALVVYNVASWERVLQWFQGMRRAKHARASLVAAQQRREEDRAAAEEGRSAEAEAQERAALGAFAAAASPRDSSAAEGGEGGKKEASSKSAGAPRSLQQAPLDARRPGSLSSGSSFLSRSFVPPRGRVGSPWLWGRGKGGGGTGPTAADGRRAAAGSELDDYDDFALGGEKGESVVGGGNGGGGGAPSANGGNPRATTFSLSRDGSLTRSRRRRQAIARQLDAEARASWYAYVAWRIDMTCALVLGVVYVLVAVLIFALGVARAPTECELSGQDRALCEETRAAIQNTGRDSGFGGVHHPHNG